jgi:acetyl esterase/lipase
MGIARRSTAARRSSGPDLTLSYGEHWDQVADITFPVPTTSSAPLVMFWHGGFWRAENDRLHVGVLAAELAKRGYVVANVGYRRTGAGGGWPTTFMDVADAADMLPSLIERERAGVIDHDRNIYAGHSAGGHLAIWAALRDRLPVGAPGATAKPPRVAGVMALAPVTDLANAHRLGENGGAVGELLGGSPGEVPERYAAADLAALGAPAAPVVVIHGDRDRLVPLDMSREYQAAWGAKVIELPGIDHFALIDPWSAAWPTILAALGALVGA